MKRHGKKQMRMMKRLLMSLGLAGVLSVTAQAAPWSFGVISDTQQTMTTSPNGVNSVATEIITPVNQQFIAKGVDLVIAVGDLGDDGSNASMTTRAAINSDLAAAGIAFYPLRGNHDVSATNFSTAFPNLPGTPGGGGSSPAGMAGDTYSFVHNNTKFMLYEYGTNMASPTIQSWTSSELAANDHTQAFVFNHADVIGQSHKDNIFGSGNDSDTATQNWYLSTLQQNNVKYVISGHDHMDHRAIITSPDGQSQVQEIISQSDSTKWYAASSGFSTRDQSISDQQNMIGYYIYTVDGPKVTGQYFATPIVNNTIGSSPVWTLEDTFGYSLNGKQFTVARGSSYTVVADQIAAGNGFRGTAMHILNGINSLTGTAEGSRAEVDDVNTGWAARTAQIASDILTVWGMNNTLGSGVTDPFALSLTYAASNNPASGDIYLATKDASGNWVLATSANTGGTSQFVLGAYNSSYGLGTYGVDPTSDTAWAVVNYAGDFAVVPEPTTLVLLGLGGVMTLLRRRK
jgi:hypothetical protein